MLDVLSPAPVPVARAWLAGGSDWAAIPSYPSGHLVVTTSIVLSAISMVSWLRWPLIPYLAVIAFTRVLFGAHFPSDVAVGLLTGTVSGLFVAHGVRALGWMPDARRGGTSPARPRSRVLGAGRAPQAVGVTTSSPR